MKYVRIPRELHTSDVLAEDACFSPGRYVRFIPPKQKGASHYAPLDKLVDVREQMVKTEKGETYRYAEIGDINVATGGVSFREMKGYLLPTNRPAHAESGDVLISTVRTYRKGIGLVTDSGNNLVTTNAMLNFCAATDFAPGVTLPYVYAFLRSEFFVEQVWSQLNRGVYPRMDTNALAKISLPIADDESVCAYVAALALAISEKGRAIRVRSAEINSQIETELTANQTGIGFQYAHPTLDELRATLRLDTGLYCKGFRAFQHRVSNYAHGATTLSAMGVRSRRGPNLAVSVIGKSLYSKIYKPGWYELIRPVNIGEYGTLSSREWLGSPKKLPTVNRGDLILGCEGFEKGRSLVLVDAPERCTTNFHGTVLVWPGAEIWQTIFVRCFLAYLRAQGVVDWVGVGGSGGHMSPEYFDYLPFPRFPDAIRERIARLYNHDAAPPAHKLTLNNFVAWHREWNDALGIWELDREMKALQQTLGVVQEKIINGKAVSLPLS
jgi:type I restriction enzyme S subunit